MTALQVHTCCQYLTVKGDWRRADYDARVIVKSVKGEDFKGFFDANIDGKPIKLTTDNKDLGLDIAGKVLASRLVELAEKPVALVPIPNSNACIDAPGNFRTLALANAVAKYANGKAVTTPALLWKKPKEKQHQAGGWRHAKHFTPQLSIVMTPGLPVVLLDDVITSGSQMLAATYLLRKAGVEVRFGMAVGRTTQVQTPKALDWVEERLEQMII